MGFVMVLAAFVLALKAYFDARRVRLQLGGLTQQFTMLDHRVAGLAEEFALLRGAPPSEAAPLTEEVAPPPEPAPVAAEPAIPEEPVAPPAPPPPPVPPAAPAPWQQWEQKLVENWLVWLGGAAIALGGVFLVKLSIDYGLMTPLVRVVLGIMLGIGLSIGAEWVRRHDLAGDAEPGAASDVPQALAAAGAATVFASLYAAHALYGFLPAGLAFALLAATAGATVAQSLRHGPLVAALGLVGAFIVPLLVTSPTPHALPLFAYLAVVTAGALALLRHRAWWWLAWPSLAGAIGWVALWLASAPDIETPVVALYLLVQFALFVAFRSGIARVGFSKERIRRIKELAATERAGDKPLIEDERFREKLAAVEVELKALEITQLRVVAAERNRIGNKPDPASSILKIKGSEIQQATSELLLEIVGPYAMPYQPERDEEERWNEPPIGPEWAGPIAPTYFNTRKVSIYGGTNEIQKNIIAKAILGL